MMRRGLQTAFILIVCGLAEAGTTLSLDAAVEAYAAGRYNVAHRAFERLASSGDNHAQLLLGIMYREGRGVVRDLEKSRNWFRMAAWEGSAEAQFMLGLSYIDEHAVEKNNASAYEWITRAAHNNNSEARRFLMLTHRHGWLALPVSESLASYWQARYEEN